MSHSLFALAARMLRTNVHWIISNWIEPRGRHVKEELSPDSLFLSLAQFLKILFYISFSGYAEGIFINHLPPLFWWGREDPSGLYIQKELANFLQASVSSLVTWAHESLLCRILCGFQDMLS